MLFMHGWAGTPVKRLMAAGAIGCAAVAAASPPADGTADVVPDAAVADLQAGVDLYQAGDCLAALGAFQRAVATGAQGGLLFYRMGYCHEQLGDAQANASFKQLAAPFFAAQVDRAEGGVDPYYYLAAIYTNDLAQPDAGDRVVRQALAAFESGAFGEAMGGEELFRLARVCGFAVDSLIRPGREASAGDAVRAEMLERRRIFTLRRAVQALEAERGSRAYRVLALNDLAAATERAGNSPAAIELYSRASGADPLQSEAGEALTRLAVAAVGEGDYALAAAAWRGVRGPDELKTSAQYGMKLAAKALALGGALPTAFEGRPITDLDRPALERGILAAVPTLRAALPGAGAAPPDPEELRRQRGIFLALMLSYLRKDYGLREFAVANQLVPFVFR